MKRSVIQGVAFIVGMTTALNAISQTAPSQQVGVSVVAGVGGGTTSMLSAGKYEQITQDNTKIFGESMAHLRNMQQIDLDYLKEINTRLLGGIQGMIVVGQEFRELSQKSFTGMVPIEDYLKLINRIRQAEMAFTAELESLTLVSRDTLPSATNLEVGDVKVTSASAGNIDMSKVVETFSSLRNKLMTEMSQMRFGYIVTKLNDRLEIKEGQDALLPDLQGLKVLSHQEIQANVDKIAELTALNGSTLRLQRQYVERLRIDVRTFVQKYGTEEAFRFRNDNDKDAKLVGFSSLQDAFYRRSYLRKKFGIPMGALRTVEFEKKTFNFETITESFRGLNEYLLMIQDQPAMSREEVVTAFENARNFVEMYDNKLTPILSKDAAAKRAANKRPELDANASFFEKFGRSTLNAKDWVTSQFADREEIMSAEDKKLEYSSNDTGFLSRANSAITFLTGRQPTAEVLLAVMRMVLADAREEMMLLQNDRAELRAYHNARYHATAESTKAWARKICQMDFSLSAKEHQNNCVKVDIKFKATMPAGQPGNDISGLFMSILNQYSLVESAKAQEAESLRQLTVAARAAGNEAEDSGPSSFE